MGRDTPTLPFNKHCQRQGGQGLGSQASRVVAGIRFPVMAGCRAPGPPALRGGNLRWAPAESPAVQAGIQTHATRRAKSLAALALAMCQPGSQTRSAWQKKRRRQGTSRIKQDTDMAALVNHFNGSGKRPVAMRRKVCCDDGSD